MYMLTHSRDVARETAERALRAPIGWMSPFWFVYGAALSVGTTWWLMNQFGRPTNLEAAHDAHIGIEAPAARLSANQETGTDAPRSEAVDAAGSEHGTASLLARAAETQAAAEVESAPTSEAVADDLTRIVGIGPRLSAALAERGVTRFAQMSAWTDEEIAEIDRALKLKGGVSRHAWVAQARRFAGQEDHRPVH